MNSPGSRTMTAEMRIRPQPPRYWRIAGIYLVLLALSLWVRTHKKPAAVPANFRIAELQAVSGEKLLDPSIRLAYWERSSADEQSPAVILLHGSPGQSRDLVALAEQLPESHRLIIPDLPGFGHSDHSIPDYSIRAHAHYVRQLLDHVGIERAHVVAFSMGGGVALNLAEIAPRRVASLTMLSAIGVQEMELLGDYRINHGLHGLQLAALWLLREGLPHMGWLDNARFNVPYARNFYDSDQRPLRQILSSYQGPMLIVHGRRDMMVPVEAALEHHRLVPQSELHLIDDNHFAVFTHPAILAARVSEFFVRVDKGSAATRASAALGALAVSRFPFDPAQIPKAMGMAGLVLFLFLAGSTFVSEDLTCIAAGVMVAQGRISFLLAAAACLAGIYAVDLLWFLLGRVLG